MASRYWLKLYHEILHDPKMGTLSDRLWRRCIEMFLIAGDYDDEGRLPPIAGMAWTLRTDADELTRELAELAGLGILSENGDRWHVTKWIERQGAVSNAERTRRCRERKRSETYYGNESVTNRYTDTEADVQADEIETTTEADHAIESSGFVAAGPALQALLDVGLDSDIAQKLTDECPEGYILGWCAESRKRKLENPPGWVRSMLVRGHAPPAAYDNGLAGPANA